MGVKYAVRCEGRFVRPQDAVGEKSIPPTLREQSYVFCRHS